VWVASGSQLVWEHGLVASSKTWQQACAYIVSKVKAADLRQGIGRPCAVCDQTSQRLSQDVNASTTGFPAEGLSRGNSRAGMQVEQDSH